MKSYQKPAPTLTLKNGLIKTTGHNLEVIFNSEEFNSLYSQGHVEIKNLSLKKDSKDSKDSKNSKNSKDSEMTGKPGHKTPNLSEEEEKAIENTKNRYWLKITSVEIKEGTGFIEFEAHEFPLESLKSLSKSVPEGIEVVWLDPNKSKFTHTTIANDGKSIYKEYDFKDLEKLFGSVPTKSESEKSEKTKNKKKDLEIPSI